MAAAALTVFNPSTYGRTLEAFDHAPGRLGRGAAAHALLAPLRWLRVGGRVGWLFTDSAPVPSDLAMSRGSPIVYNLVDVSAVLRLVYREADLVHAGARVDLGIEAGLVLGDATMRGVPQFIAAPRLAVSIFAGFEGRPTGLIFGGRLG